jgi:cytochrome c oxidase cbb3-type subunit 1
MNELDRPPRDRSTDLAFSVAFHSLFWLCASNLVGLLLALLLLEPGIGHFLAPLTYGRWMPLHLNLQLYGWCSLPLVGWLFKVYGVEQSPARHWGRSALWVWSLALIVGAGSWLAGQSSGKLFLDWTGYSRCVFPMALLYLWGVLAFAHLFKRGPSTGIGRIRRWLQSAGLVLLLPVPLALYGAADPQIYPSVNPETGGPTGASLLESTLGIIFLLLMLPWGGARVVVRQGRDTLFPWGWFLIQVVVALALDHGNISHRHASQVVGLATLLPWVFLMPVYYRAFVWPPTAAKWLYAWLGWWLILVLSACAMFFPGVLDHVKFTDALVGHSHMAMAGFISSLNLFLLTAKFEVITETFASRFSFVAWQGGVLGYVAVMLVAGCFEGARPAFTVVPGALRNGLYGARLLCGGTMASVSIFWLAQVVRRILVTPSACQHLTDESA